MKKLAIIILALALVGGCAAIKTAVTAVQQMLCVPTEVQQTQADAAKTFIADAIAFGAVLANTAITADQAKATLDKIQAGVCVALTDLKAALDYIDQLGAQVQQVKAMKRAGPVVAPRVPDLSALRKAVE